MRWLDALRDRRGLAWLDRFALDLKLAARLLARYPWLTIVGCAVLMTGVCLLACVVPARRALRVEPARALTADV
jgi:ABC-type lipoprotein release transport system permease subunit